MHSCLIIVEKPDGSVHEKAKFYNIFQSGIEAYRTQLKNTEWLAENVFLITLDNGLRAQTLILHLAHENKLPYRLLFFDKAPDWLKG